MQESDWFSLLTIGFVAVFSTAAVTFALLRVALRLADQNRDLQKANLALSERPAAHELAVAMEETDRAEVAGSVGQRQTAPVRRMAQ